MGFLALARVLHKRAQVQGALPFLEALIDERCRDEEDFCWGYPFHRETCFGTFREGTPLITTTPYGYEAFDEAHEQTGSSESLAIMESVGRAFLVPTRVVVV